MTWEWARPRIGGLQAEANHRRSAQAPSDYDESCQRLPASAKMPSCLVAICGSGRAGLLDLGVRIVGTQPEYKWAAVDSNRLPPRFHKAERCADHAHSIPYRERPGTVLSGRVFGAARRRLTDSADVCEAVLNPQSGDPSLP